MYLEQLSLKNFKCFQDQALVLSKITVLLGANSSGKTSLIYSLLAALQSDQFPLTLSVNGPLVTLGDFRAISYRHRADHSVGIGLTFAGHQLGMISFKGLFASSPRAGMPKIVDGEFGGQALRLTISKEDQYKAVWKYDSTSDPMRTAWESAFLGKFFEALTRAVKEATETSKKESGTRMPAIEDIDAITRLPPASGTFSFASPSEFFKLVMTSKSFYLIQYISALMTGLTEFQKAFTYLGSFRLEPQRTYYQVSKGDLKVGRDGTNYLEQINDWEEKKSPELAQLSNSLRKLRLLTRLRTNRLRSGMFEVNVRTSATSVPVSLADVGFGIAQLLPILVADLQLPKGGTLAVSQPEIHLHPSVQADLADYFVDRALRKGYRYIIETHSEYFINRLRLLIAKGKIAPQDLSILYLSSDGPRITSNEIVFNPDGRIEGAPKDFFQTYMVDVMNIAIEAQA